MRRDDLHLVRDAEFLEKLDRVRHRRPVRLAAHDDTDLRRAIAHHPIPPAGRDASPPPLPLATARRAGHGAHLMYTAFTAWYQVAARMAAAYPSAYGRRRVGQAGGRAGIERGGGGRGGTG